MFVDEIKIKVKSGKGGDGMVAFRREKYVPNGGPAGGDGGRGGNVVFKVDEGKNTLRDFRYNKIYKADDGGNGGNKRMSGRGAQDLVVSVPAGTIIYNNDKVIADLTDKKDHFIVAKGGRGGRGNIHFASSKNSAPEIAENGEPGQELELKLELKLLADVGLVGFPSAGKSTLLSTVTNSKPKIGDYQFTTLSPNLGIVKEKHGKDFVIADLPGLIEGASNGVGLGIQFLRHIERTRVILHLVDMSGADGSDPFENYKKINKELANYDKNLLLRPQIIVATKMDVPDSKDNLAEFKKKLAQDKQQNMRKVIPISSVSHLGLDNLMSQTAALLEKTPIFNETPVTDNKNKVYTADELSPEKNFKIDRNSDGSWVLSGDKIERLFKMTNTEHDQSMLRFARQLKGMGIDEALKKAGAKDGDEVSILDFTFNYVY